MAKQTDVENAFIKQDHKFQISLHSMPVHVFIINRNKLFVQLQHEIEGCGKLIAIIGSDLLGCKKLSHDFDNPS